MYKTSKQQQRRQYKEYLKSDRWKLKRKEAFDFYGKTCKKCGSVKKI